jgi:AcrR family transcriptional regulator
MMNVKKVAMASAYESFGRTNQKMRTRAAIKAAAADFIERGETPTMEQIAEAALVSKSTAYRYFPTLEALIAEIMLDNAIQSDMEKVFEAAKTTGTAEARLDAVIRADHTLVMKHEHAFRTAIGVMLTSHTDDSSRLPRRPGNRLRYIAEALTPLTDDIGNEQLERLVMALALCVGIESLVVLNDICGLNSTEAEEIKLWIANTLLKETLQASADT